MVKIRYCLAASNSYRGGVGVGGKKAKARLVVDGGGSASTHVRYKKQMLYNYKMILILIFYV